MRTLSIISILTLVVFSTMQLKATSPNEKLERDVTKEYELGDFSEIHLRGGFTVHIDQAKSCALTVQGDQDDLDKLTISSKNGVLKVFSKQQVIGLDKVTLHINVKTLERLRIEGGGKITSEGYLDVKDLNINIEGGIRMDMQLAAKHVDLHAEGGVWVNLEGVSKYFDVHIEGAGRVNARQLKSEDVSVHIEGAGLANVHAEEELDATIEGVGKVNYRGNPDVRKQIDGLGRVTRD
ncbi:DUF2807 domain-containing protein [Puteibacter caeruleilacunae]|nr:DUF2807 domain-containing protein [Puteibacter caeruleilacunae]